LRCFHFEGRQGQEQSASLNENQHPCPLGGSVENRNTYCKRHSLHGNQSLSGLAGSPEKGVGQLGHIGFTVVGLYHSSADLDYVGYYYGEMYVSHSPQLFLCILWEERKKPYSCASRQLFYSQVLYLHKMK
jgi:hypothetical protein